MEQFLEPFIPQTSEYFRKMHFEDLKSFFILIINSRCILILAVGNEKQPFEIKSEDYV